jgi:hypothetical protein
MCLILEIGPDAEPISVDEHVDVWGKNKDGGCVIDLASGDVIYRGLDGVEMGAALIGRKNVIAHWRMATSGPKDEDRCHGWQCYGGRILHNGILSDWTGVSGHSDTSALVAALIDGKVNVMRAQALLGRIAGRSTIVVVPQGGGMPIWLGGDNSEEWRGRKYSNHYAWTPTIHGKPAPVVTSTSRSYYHEWAAEWDAKTPPSGQRVWTMGKGWEPTTPDFTKPVQRIGDSRWTAEHGHEVWTGKEWQAYRKPAAPETKAAKARKPRGKPIAIMESGEIIVSSGPRLVVVGDRDDEK